MTFSTPEPLPILELLPELRLALERRNTAIVQAPPGAGKSTLLPLELLDAPWLGNQKILMLEPRRLAAKAVAARMAQLLGESVGQTVGYRVRFEQQVGPTTRLEVLTEGILTRRLQRDQALDGVGLVIFDEFHERSLQADLALALTKQVQGILREDLRIVVMSATLESELLCHMLQVPLLECAGRQFPVSIRYLPSDPQGKVSSVMANAVERALEADLGDILAFLPGQAEIKRTAEFLKPLESYIGPQIRIQLLYGDLSPLEQQAALLPDPQGRRKVVLATSIAETSLTIAGIGVVIDSGQARVSKFDAGTGLSRLQTVRVSQDSADQRAGRAGRLGPGVCYRLWSEATNRFLEPSRTPEILEADLAPLLLELTAWGVNDVTELSWLQNPPKIALEQARVLLEALGAISEASLEANLGSKITARGREMLALPTHPRLAHLLLEGKALGWGALAADLAALLEERDPLRGPGMQVGSDLILRLEGLSNARNQTRGGSFAQIERLAAQWRKLLNVKLDSSPKDSNIDPYVVGQLVALAYPERIAQKRSGERLNYRLSSGRGVRLREDDPLAGEPWLAVAHLDAGTVDGQVHLAAPLEPSDIPWAIRDHQNVSWDKLSGVLVARLERKIGGLVLDSKPLERIPDVLRQEILCKVLCSEGLGLLNWTPALLQWRARVQSVRVWLGDTQGNVQDESWPDVSDTGLLDTLELWLAPHLNTVRRREDFAKLELFNILSSVLNWNQSRTLEELAPAKMRVNSGSQITLEYPTDGSSPVLAVRLQEVFGLTDTPSVANGRVPVTLHLLSPAYRPVQVTQDLRSFWKNAYFEVRKELKIRYPKHSWPEDPSSAVAVRGAVRRR